MPYSNQDKMEFAIKDAKYSIGAAMGNAFSKAVDFYLSDKNINVGRTEHDAWIIIEGLRDMFFKGNQEAVNRETIAWLEENEHRLRIEYGLETPVIDVDAPEQPDLPTK